jgi:hypothetical protein
MNNLCRAMNNSCPSIKKINDVLKNISIETFDKHFTHMAVNDSIVVIDYLIMILTNISLSNSLTERDVEYSLQIVDAIIDLPDVVLVQAHSTYNSLIRYLNVLRFN